MSSSFVLTIGGDSDGKGGAKFYIKKGQFTKNQKEQPDFKVGDESLKASLNSLRFTKKIYAPCSMHVSLTLALSDDNDKTDIFSPKSHGQYIDAFMGKSVMLQTVDLGEDDNGKTMVTVKETIAKNYYIQEVRPLFSIQKITGSGSTADTRMITVSVDLDIYSNDHKLAVDKFCRAYTGMRFKEEIVSVRNKDILELANVDLAQKASLHYLLYKDSASKECELRQPYLVQYNESFYNFMARTSNRCGEFLFFEDGQLHIGLPYTSSELNTAGFAKKTITEADVVSVSTSAIQQPTVEVTPFSCSTVQEEETYTGDPYALNHAVAQEDHFFKIEKDGFYDVNYEYFLNWSSIAFEILAAVLNASNLMEMIATAGLEQAEAAAEAAVRASGKNDNYNKIHFTDRAALKADQTDAADVKNCKVAYPFSSNLDNAATDNNRDFAKNLEAAFFTAIYEREKTSGEDVITVNLGKNYRHVKLGDVVSVFGTDYVVVGVTGRMELSAAADENYGFTAVPLQDGKALKLAIPPVFEGGHICTSHVQRAFITNSSDPQKLGRVRIRFPWQQDPTQQKKDAIEAEKEKTEAQWAQEDKAAGITEDQLPEDKKKERKEKRDKWEKQLEEAEKQGEMDEIDTSSPWIRMASPIIYEDGGFYFQPEAGSEVLVDFEGGNVEKPFVVGMLRNKTTDGTYDTRVIQSRNGHKIIFSDPKFGPGIVGGAVPAVGLISKFIPGAAGGWLNCVPGLPKEMNGGITLTDSAGLYEISMSSDKRAISIECPLGKVDISAFTGITISAPNGNISIEGKNVSISASNNLTLTSGTRIKDLKESILDDFVESFVGGVVDMTVGKLIDLKLFRSIYEAFVKPCAGTLKIKSFRYLMMESGAGDINIPRDKYKAGYKRDDDDVVAMGVIDKLTRAVAMMEEHIVDLHAMYTVVSTKRVSLFNTLMRHNQKNPAPTQNAVYGAVDNLLNAMWNNGPVNFDYNLIDLVAQDNRYDREKAEIQGQIDDLQPAVARLKAKKDTQINFTADAGVGIGGSVQVDYINIDGFSNPDLDIEADKKKFIQDRVKDLLQAMDLFDIPSGDWSEMVKKLDMKSTFGETVKAWIIDRAKKDAFGISDESAAELFKPQSVWGPDSKGEILISGDPSHTMVLEKGAFKKNTNKSLPALKAFLKTLS